MKRYDGHLIGRTDDGDRVYTQVRISGAQDKQPVLHITGRVYTRRATRPYRVGQTDKALSEIVTFARGWNAERRDRLVEVWDRWHLNDLRAECPHQRARGETRATHPEAVCPDCSYRLGSAWLYEPLPEDVLAFVQPLLTT